MTLTDAYGLLVPSKMARFRLWLARKIAGRRYVVIPNTPCLTVAPDGGIQLKNVTFNHGYTTGIDWKITAGSDCP